jgi:hypothetical protein
VSEGVSESEEGEEEDKMAKTAKQEWFKLC